jgi:hypothetical protein
VALAAISLLSGCDKNPSDKGKTEACPAFAGGYVLVIGTNYQEGSLSLLNTADMASSVDLMHFSGDAVVGAFEGSAYILDRTLATLTRVSGGAFSDECADYQVSVGAGSNPYGMAFRDANKAYVVRFGSDSVLIINPSTGAPLGYVNLEEYEASVHADSLENTCGMSCGLVAGSRFFVACQRLEAWMPGDTSLLVVINTANDSIEKAIRLRLRNPQDIKLFNGKIYLASAGNYGVRDGGIEAINLTSLESEGVIISDQDAGGDLSRLVIVNADKGYAAVDMANDDFTVYWTEIRPFNPSAKTLAPKLAYVENGFGGLACDDSLVYVGERGANPGVVVVNPANDAKIKGPVSTGLPPYSMAVVKVE